ncbi:MAG: VIT domain-containing protein [Microcoleaceae cyanobacterium]
MNSYYPLFLKSLLLAKLSIGLILFANFGSLTSRSSIAEQRVHSGVSIPFLQIDQAQAQIHSTAQCRSDCPVAGLYVRSETDISQTFPLEQTEVKARVSGNLSRVEVTQTFTNPFDTNLEAIYVFPLPDEAAVDDMEIQIGDRIIKSAIETREQAQAIYQAAKSSGQTAGLLEQERANIFTQSLANIKPGESIQVTIRYTDPLKFEQGDYEFVFPMVVGPRYVPGSLEGGSSRTSRVPDGDRITPPVLPPQVRSGHDIQVDVEIDAGVPIQNVRSASHQILTQKQGEVTQVTLAEGDTIPNKDLILRYQVSGDQTQAMVMTESDSRGGHFAAYLIPALQYKPAEIVAKDVVFLIDTSGSQRGEPLAKSKQLMRRMVQGLNAEDTFAIIDFSDTTSALSETPLDNTATNRQRATGYINQLEARGGTELLNGIRAVLDYPAPPSDRLRSIVLITDGYIGNETEVLAEVQSQLKPGNRLYSFGVGSSVNRFLLNRLAEVGRGTVQITRPDAPSAAVTEKFFQQINNPVLTNIQVSWQGGGAATEFYPAAPSDLFANQPLVVLGRKPDQQAGQLRITGTQADGQSYEQTLNVSFAPSSANPGNPAIAQLWGRAKIKHLAHQMFAGETKSGVEAITQTALDYRLLSQYTAFIAVSEEVRVNPNGTSQTVQVPVELPEGVSYEGIFGRNPEQAQIRGFSGGVTGADRLQTRLGTSQQPMPSGGIRSTEIAPVAPPTGSRPQPLPRPNIVTGASQIQVVSASSLEQSATAELNRYLQGVNLPEPVQGQLIFELVVKQGRIQRIILDDRASTLKPDQGSKQAITIDRIRRSLQTWQPPAQLSGTVRIDLVISASS